MDFSEKVNTNEIKLKDSTKLKKMNMCQAVTNALDTALATNPKYVLAWLNQIALMSLERTSSSVVCSAAPWVSTKSMALTECSILHCRSKASLVSRWVWPLLVVFPSLRSNSPTTSSQLSIR